MSGIKVNGLDQLNAKLRKNMDLNTVKTIVKRMERISRKSATLCTGRYWNIKKKHWPQCQRWRLNCGCSTNDRLCRIC